MTVTDTLPERYRHTGGQLTRLQPAVGQLEVNAAKYRAPQARPVRFDRHPYQGPECGDGIVEAIRALRVARRGAVTARTQTTNQLKSLLVTAPPEVRERMQDRKTPALAQACARLRTRGLLSDPLQAVKVALRRLARRHQHLSTEINDADAELHGLVATAAPGMTDRLGVGVEMVGQLLTTVGDNP
jgi:transposase